MTSTHQAGARRAAADDLLQQAVERLPAYRQLPERAHTPDFRLVSFPHAPHEGGAEWCWIYDGIHKIGMIQTWGKEIEMFRFAPPPAGTTADYSIPAIHHWATLVGAKISINAPLWQGAKSFHLDFVSREGPVLEFKTATELGCGSTGEGWFRLAWDTKLGYVWNCRMDCLAVKPAWLEFCNLLAGGVSVCRDDRKRWQKVLSGVGPGKMTWFYHNPLNIPAYGLASNGFAGFVREPDMNPLVALESVNAPVRVATCDQWYDLGIQADASAVPEEGGRRHIGARYRFLSIPAAVSEALEDQAQPVNAGPSGIPGFREGVVNDFEHGIDGGKVYNGATWRNAAFDRARGHSGHVSLKLSGAGQGKLVASSPNKSGAAVRGDSARRYRLSAWVRSELKAGEAYVEAVDCFWNWNDVRAARRSRGIEGTTGWTELTVEFQPVADDPFLVIKLCVDGTGDAWFDDVALTQVG